MKIIHLASGDLWAGAEVQLFHLTKRLVRVKDVKLLIVLQNHGQLEYELKNQGIDVVVLDETVLSAFGIFRKLYAIVHRFQPDIVHTHRNKENLIGGLVAKLNGKKSVRTVHGASELAGGILNMKRYVFDTLDKMAALFLQQKIIAVSSELKDKLSHYLPSSKLAMIENCVDIKYVESKSLQPYSGIKALPADAFHVAFIGRFVPVKRVDLFYAIAKSVVRGNSSRSVYFHMLGDGPLKSVIEAQVCEDGVADNIHLHGFISNVAPVLKQMNLLLFTSDHEGLPMTLLEAMTLRVPVLSRLLPSIRSVLCEGKCGYFVDSNSAVDFANVIHHIMSNPDEVNIRVAAARNLIESKYNIDINVKKYLELYKEVLGRRMT